MAHKWKQQPSEDNGKVFFRIILPFILQQNKLSLPVKFLKRYGDELGNEVMLRVPDGRVWNIQLMKDNNLTCLAAGLTEFFQYYSICYGHFLVFKYKGMSSFSVRIIDRTTCEIEYPNEKEDNLEDEKSAEILCSDFYKNSSEEKDDKKTIHKKRGKFQLKRKDGVTGKMPKFAKEHKIVRSKIFDVTLSRMPQGSKKSVELAMKSKPKNPSFLILVTKSCILNSLLFVPSSFASIYFGLGGKRNEIKVVDSDGGEWIVHTNFIWRGKSLRLEGGWDEFYSDNYLKEGDVCVFELLQKHSLVLKVSIFRISGSTRKRKFGLLDVTSSDSESSEDDDFDENSEPEMESQLFVTMNFDEIASKLSPKSKKALDEARMYKPKMDAFMVVIQATSSRDRRKMDVPAEFVKKYKHGITGDVIRVQIINGKYVQNEFCIRVKWRNDGGLVLREGWSNFVWCNNLDTGGVCIFEVLNSEKLLLKAMIFRAGSE